MTPQVRAISFSNTNIDKGSKAKRHVSFWHPQPNDNRRPLGSFCIDNYDPIDGRYTALLIGAVDTSPGNNSVVASPTGYAQVWVDKGSSAEQKGSLWRPVPPSGYVVLGHVTAAGYDAPSTDKIWCLREDLVIQQHLAALKTRQHELGYTVLTIQCSRGVKSSKRPEVYSRCMKFFNGV
ncbi:hypothetical protein LMH87_001186 [Akanthomyces muscarius]|uniref:Uncharacterized protein n=1 Tax=Akanthomyces muscarius TaxID=2231603 RepID=A0A9W8QG22_AKAMU|nr:hypothetical protein LMH87_001186 [Akanthomyces muscarius]KAJ4155967.1 hypothetical protein LMH87_001186 [Akanthomyces muscarius]